MTMLWFSEYKDSKKGSLEEKIWQAAVYCSGDEDRARRVAAHAFENKCSVIHSAWLDSDRKFICGCDPCQKRRK